MSVIIGIWLYLKAIVEEMDNVERKLTEQWEN